MPSLAATFSALSAAKQKAFVAYVTAGDPDFDRSLEVLHALAQAGTNIIELGLPFSDPLADGIVNQMAAQRALEAGMSTKRTLELISRFREHNHHTPLVIFSYLNPIFTYGFGRFERDALAAGANGILLLDLPPDEAALSDELAELDGLDHIRLIAPTTPPERIGWLASRSQGFIYALSRSGVTGAHSAPSTAVAGQVAAIRAHTATPICVGFGIASPAQAAAVAAHADGVVVGSAIVREISQHLAAPAPAVRRFIEPFIKAVQQA